MVYKADSYTEKSVQIIMHARLFMRIYVLRNLSENFKYKTSAISKQQFMLKAYRMEHSLAYSLLLSRRYL